MVSFDYLCASFKKLTDAPDKFLSSGDLAGDFKCLLKLVYDFTQSQERTSLKALPELIVKDFDDEQIWQELELQNEDSLPNLISKAARLLVSKNLTFPVKTEVKDVRNAKKLEKRVRETVKRSEAVSSEEEFVENSEDEDMSEGSDVDEDPPGETIKRVKIVPSEVDDDFFKLSEMEAYLKNQEEKQNDLNVDLFNDMVSEDEVEDDRPMYKDFFDDGDAPAENYADEDRNSNICSDDDFNGDISDGGNVELPGAETEKKVKFDLRADSDSESSENDTKVRSSYETREERLRKKIAELEDEALEEKAWPLKGEICAENRPINSLLEEVVEFDTTRRPPPIVTEETSDRLEDIIKRRIRDRAYDDVERKVKPVSTPHEFKKKLVLDQEKSKKSLAQVYEEEYLKKKEEQNPDSLEKPDVEPQEHTTIRNMMNSLFIKLDALSNFFFVPKPVAPDLRIISNAPAVNVEEVTPSSVSHAKLLAPEEIGGSFKKSLASKEEKTKTDKKRERRKKKIHQAKKFKAQAARDSVTKPNNYQDQLNQVMKFKNVTKLQENTDKTKSSTQFFSKLQDELQNPNKQNRKRKRNQSDKTAKKLKL